MNRAVIVLLPMVAACGSDGPSCGVTSALVTRVIDGDTVELETGDRVRYLLVNAPETTNGHDDCYGTNAATFNSDLVLNKTVQLTYDVECEDRYDRLLAYVSVDGQEVNTLLVQRGFACVLHISPDGDKRYDEFKGYQADAKAMNKGLWGACDPIPCN